MSQSQFYNKPVTGSITTQNLNIATTATANSAVVISVYALGTSFGSGANQYLTIEWEEY